MAVYTHRLAKIDVRVETDLPLFDGRNDQFAPFSVSFGTLDISCCIQQIQMTDALSLPVSRADIDRLAQAYHLTPADWNSPLLRVPAVRSRLLDCEPLDDWVSVEFCHDLVSRYDFVHLCFDLFYSADSIIARTSRHFGAGFVIPFLPAFDAVMLHSSSVLCGDRVALFLAPDDGGKTTAARLAPNPIILSDDQNIVRFQDNMPVVYGTPWGRHTNSAHHARLGGLFFLEKAPAFELLPCSAADALLSIWHEHKSGYSALPLGRRMDVIALLSRLTNSVPAYHLRFPSDQIDWNAIDMAMRCPPRLFTIAE